MGVDVRRVAWRGMALVCLFGSLGLFGGCDSDPVEPDASADDAGTERDASPECVSPEDCDDGFFCNGEERCDDGRCEPGPPPRCDDGIECTLDVCDEVARACRSAAPDRDGDGFLDRTCRGDDGLPLGRDCDDEDGDRFPGNPERCDAEDHDEDCDDTTFGEVDDDGDGEFAARCCNEAEDGTRACGVDCDDTRPGVNNTVPEVCNGLDDDCDGMVDEGVLIAGFIDADFDGQGDSSRPTETCGSRPGVADIGGDCDDANPAIRAGGPELCDLEDNDCDGETDESPVEVDWFRDLDNDGFGAAASGVIRSCAPQSGHSLLDLDCNDDDNGVNPGQAEQCNGIDDDCFGGADFAIGVNNFEDDDGDGLVDIDCEGPAAVDCDDADPRTGAGAAEVCDGRDNDCDERVDEGATDAVFYRDTDGDGWGSETSGAMVACSPAVGFVVRGGDCDDTSVDISPDGTETCDGIDEDCNGVVDDGSALTSCGLPNTSLALCDRGRCEVETCDAGFRDCDGMPSTGCEARVDMATSCGCAMRDCTAIPNAVTATCAADAFGGDYACQLTCDAGRDDCDGSLGNGCETDTQRSPIHCGGCGNTCFDVANGRAGCDAGACSFTCEPGFADCDGMPENGCEADLTQPSNCGSCGFSCTSAVGSLNVSEVACAPDFLGRLTCQVSNCDDGTDDCNGVFSDGCESNLLMDSGNCGGCRQQCLDPDTQCQGAACQTLCPGVRQDCDGLSSNGCEADTLGDPNHCGACDSRCDSDERCDSGLCCEADFANCDGMAISGCEADLRSDTDCGGCGNACALGFECLDFECRRVCAEGMADCDPDALGCETMLGTEDDCGSCGDACGANGLCDEGNCGCAPSFADCEERTPGCETETREDELNCGGCNFVCRTGEVCSMGACAAPIQVVTGDDFSCALLSDNSVWCWGSDSAGQLGLGDGDQSTATPVAVPALDGTLMLSAGAQHACALRGNGTVWCWGNNASGQVGCAPGTCDSPVQASFPDDDQATFVEVEGTRSCVITRGPTNRISCWGDASLPLSVDLSQLSAPPRKLVLGSDFGCVQTDFDDVLCWGSNTHGQLGDGGTATRNRPEVVVSLPSPVREMAAGEQHVCVSTVSQQLWCWGSSSTGENGQSTDTNVPLQVTGGFVGALSVGASARGTCITRQGLDDVVCMGADDAEELGDGAGMMPSTSLAAVSFPETVEVGPLSAGPDANGVCGLSLDGRIFCWGDNSDGQLGSATPSLFDTARLVAFP